VYTPSQSIKKLESADHRWMLMTDYVGKKLTENETFMTVP